MELGGVVKLVALFGPLDFKGCEVVYDSSKSVDWESLGLSNHVLAFLLVIVFVGVAHLSSLASPVDFKHLAIA